MAKIQTIKINNEVVYPRTIKQAIVDLQGTPTVITNDGSDGDSVAIRLTDNGSFRRSFRIDLTTPTNTGSEDKVAIGTLIVEANNIISGVQHHGYYYGDDLGDILAEVAIYQDDTDQGTFYLVLQHESDLDFVTFAITPLDGGEVDAFITNAGDDHTKVEDATITQVGGSSDVFWATYGSTTAAEMDAAIASGKVICAERNGMYYAYSGKIGNVYYFYSITSTTIYRIVLNNGTWQTGSFVAENAAGKKSSWSATPNDTNYPTEKLVKDSIDAVDKVFWATYVPGGTSTSAADIESALNNSKLVLCYYNTVLYQFERITSTYIFLSAITDSGSTFRSLRVTRGTSSWTPLTTYEEVTSNKVSTLSGNETNTTKYPNTKAVADALGKMGVISQTQTWSGTGSNPRTYSMSGQTYGIIPQSFIDLAESAGATFNSTSGYFELNGLTDISYAEMRDIVCEWQPNPWTGQQGMFKFIKARTNIPPQNNIASITAFNGLRLSYSSGEIEIIKLLQDSTPPAQLNSLQLAFFWARKLRRIEHEILLNTATNFAQAFEQCYSLEEVRLKSVKASLSFNHCSLLSKDSLLYLINNEASTGPITITLHASVYAKCQSGGEWYSDISTALSAHTNVSLASA